MRLATIILYICFLILTNGCSSQPAANQTASAPSPSESATASATPNAANTNATTPSPSTSSATKPRVDACTLLTSDEIKAAQGEPLKDTKASSQGPGDLIVTQCYYELPTPSNSISLTLTESGPEKPGRQTVREFWEKTFPKGEGKGERERKKEREEEKKEPRAQPKGEEEESVPPEAVRGVGDEAFWSASRVGGALYVLKGDRFIRISVGGKGDVQAKLKKSKTLAQKALRRL